jgi:DNA-binding NarL/FixJ family response regulator
VKIINKQSFVRILVVDDFAAWRDYVLEKLRENRWLQVVGVASDGLEAISKADELQPDLILLDIGLSKLSGIGAAPRIRQVAPKSKMLFLSQETDPDVARKALNVGGRGYVVKSDAENELLAAVEAVMSGGNFVSSKLAGHVLLGVADLLADAQFQREGLSGATLLSSKKVGHCHQVLFYEDNASLLDGFTRFVGAALKAGNPAIVVATESHRDSLFQRLQACGLDPRVEIIQGRYIVLDAVDTLATFMTNDLPDPVRFLNVMSDLISTATQAAKGEHPRVAACGECAPLLWAEGKADAAIRLEELWNNIAITYDIDILCGYPSRSFRDEGNDYIFRKICEYHSAVNPFLK